MRSVRECIFLHVIDFLPRTQSKPGGSHLFPDVMNSAVKALTQRADEVLSLLGFLYLFSIPRNP